MLAKDVAQRWSRFFRRSRPAQTAVVGIYGQSRGGTNFIATALHYHPQLFAVNEHVFDYRVPLQSFWRKGSVFRCDGRQDKQVEQITAVVFNKMQEFFPELWNPRCDFPESSRFVFYLRNPIRVHLSREVYRQKHKPDRTEWADTPQNFFSLLTETREILEAYEILRRRYPCLVVSHEYFCCQHEAALSQLHEFLGVVPLPPGNPRDMLRRCGRCGRELVVARENGQDWLSCPRDHHHVSGAGRFNPLLPIDRQGVRENSWKTLAQIKPMMRDLRRILGNEIADYFWHGDYAENLFIDWADLDPARIEPCIGQEDRRGFEGKEVTSNGRPEQRVPT